MNCLAKQVTDNLNNTDDDDDDDEVGGCSDDRLMYNQRKGRHHFDDDDRRMRPAKDIQSIAHNPIDCRSAGIGRSARAGWGR